MRNLILIAALAMALAFGLIQMAQAQQNCHTTCYGDGNGGQQCWTHCGGYA